MHYGENRRWVPLKACQVSILTTQNGILFLGRALNTQQNFQEEDESYDRSYNKAWRS